MILKILARAFEAGRGIGPRSEQDKTRLSVGEGRTCENDRPSAHFTIPDVKAPRNKQEWVHADVIGAIDPHSAIAMPRQDQKPARPCVADSSERSRQVVTHIRTQAIDVKMQQILRSTI